MSTIDLKGYTALMDKYYSYPWERPDTSVLDYSIPKVSFSSSINNDLLSGISISTESINKPIRYKDDIFSELPMKVFDKTYNAQIAKVMNTFRDKFYKRISNNPIRSVIPKLEYSYDGEEEAEVIRMISQWDQGNAMIYFSFEKNNEESNFGMIWNDNQNKNYSTRSGNLYLSKTDDVIHEIMEFLYRVYNV